MAIVRIQCTGRWRRDLGWGVHTDGREVVSPLTLYLWGIATLGVGLAGEGAARPFPCLGLSPGTVFVDGDTACPLRVTGNGFPLPPGTISIYL